MKTIADTMRKRMAEKHLGKEMIGVTAIRVIRDYFGLKSVKPKVEGLNGSSEDFLDEKYEIDGYMKFNKIFIKTSNQAVKIELFKHKKEILAQVNEAIAKLGYSVKMTEIITK